MNLQFTEFSYNHYALSCEVTLINHDEDPAFNYTLIFDSEHVRVKQGHVVKRGDIAHNLDASGWQTKPMIQAMKNALLSVEDKTEVLEKHLDTALAELNKVMVKIRSSQINHHRYKSEKLISQYSAANEQMHQALNQASWSGLMIKGIEQEDIYPQVDAQYAGQHRDMDLDLRNLNERIDKTIKESTRRLDASIQELDSRFEEQAKDLEFKTNDLTAKAEESFKFVGNIKARIVNELMNEQGELKAKTTEMEKELKSTLDAATAYYDEKAEVVDALLEKIEVTSERLAQLAQVEAASTMVEQFREAAVDARSSARWWTFAFFVFGLLGASAFVYLIQYAPQPEMGSNDMGWVTIFGRLSLTATLAYLLGYSGLQATRQRNAKLYFDRMAIEMVSLDAYLSPYDIELRLKIKSELMTAYFGKVTAPGYQAEGSLPSLDIVKHVTEAIAAKAKGATEDAKKDDAKGESNVDLALQISAKSAPAKDENKPNEKK